MIQKSKFIFGWIKNMSEKEKIKTNSREEFNPLKQNFRLAKIKNIWRRQYKQDTMVKVYSRKW